MDAQDYTQNTAYQGTLAFHGKKRKKARFGLIDLCFALIQSRSQTCLATGGCSLVDYTLLGGFVQL